MMKIVAVFFFVVTVCTAGMGQKFSLIAGQTGAASKAEPWAPAQVVNAEGFASELAASKNDSRPTILYVGFRTLFIGGHIPGAQFHGTTSTEAGIAGVKGWAASLPKNTNLVIYCGCCPFEKCPNIRPAFLLLQEMGFTRLRILSLPTSFAVDWAEKNYPIEKGLRTKE